MVPLESLQSFLSFSCGISAATMLRDTPNPTGPSPSTAPAATAKEEARGEVEEEEGKYEASLEAEAGEE